MSVRYYSEFEQYNTRPNKRYTDLMCIEISDDGYSGEPEYLTLGASPLRINFSEGSAGKDTIIIGSQAQFQLLATDDFSLDDLYTDVDMKWKVDVKRNDAIIWKGFIIPDGCSERFIDPPFIVNTKAIDGIGVLKNAPFYSSDGSVITGKKSVLSIIVECLSKTGLGMNINTFCNIEYEEMVTGSNPFAQTYVWADRFIKDSDNDIPMDCASVLHSLLTGWGCKLFQRKGEWFIINMNDVSSFNGIIELFKYNSSGVFIGKEIVDANLILGNNEGDIIHCDYDQIKATDKAFKVAKIKYTYGFLANLVNRDTQRFTGNGVTLQFFGWDKLNDIDAEPSHFAGSVAIINGTSFIDIETRALRTKDEIPVFGISKMKVECVFNAGYSNGIPYTVTLNDNGSITNLSWDGKWVTELTNNYFDSVKKLDGGATSGKNKIVRVSRDFELPETLNSNAYIKISLFPVIYFPDNTRFTGRVGLAEIYDFKISAISTGEDIVSETHNVINNADYTYSPKEFEVDNGDSSFYGYEGTLFKSDTVTPTDLWRKKGTVPFYSFLEITTKDLMWMHSRPMRIYEGTVYGYFDYFSIFSITHLNGKFMVTSADYDFKSNKTKVVMMEIDHTPVPVTYHVDYTNREPDLGGITNV